MFSMEIPALFMGGLPCGLLLRLDFYLSAKLGCGDLLREI